jgi:hypothetical protein
MVHAVLIAANRDDAVGWVARQPWLVWSDVVWISPRSRDRCRGETADVVLLTDEAGRRLSSRVISELRDVALPCTASRAARNGGPS